MTPPHISVRQDFQQYRQGQYRATHWSRKKAVAGNLESTSAASFGRIEPGLSGRSRRRSGRNNEYIDAEHGWRASCRCSIELFGSKPAEKIPAVRLRLRIDAQAQSRNHPLLLNSSEVLHLEESKVLMLSTCIRFGKHLTTASVLCSCAGAPLAAQAATSMQERPCAECQLDVDTIAIIGAPRDGLSGWPTSMSVDADGRFYMVFPGYEESVQLYSAAGEFLRGVGGAGRGPGEFIAPRYVEVGQGDSLFVLDPHNARISVFSPEHRYVRSIGIPPTAVWTMNLGGGRFVVNARINSPGRVGFPLHRVGVDGSLEDSFGSSRPVSIPSQPGAYRRRAAHNSSGHLWTIPFAGIYELQLWTTEGTLLRSWQRHVSWYPESRESWDQIPGRAPFPRIRGLWEDDSELVWIVASIPAADWQEGISEPRTIERGVYYSIEDYSMVFDTRIEVFNPQTNEVILSRLVDDGIGISIAPGVMAIASENPDFTTRLTVVRLSLSRR